MLGRKAAFADDRPCIGLLPMNRTDLFKQLSSSPRFDIAIMGGGATGLGVALEASVRGYKVVLFDYHDFAKGTSSRSTKLIHGGGTVFGTRQCQPGARSAA